jgi:hypothetical protein
MSEPWTQYEYHNTTDDENDDFELSKRIAAIDIDQPMTHGGVFNHLENQNISFDQYTSSVPPDVNEKTRIISVLSLPQHRAQRNIDIWFLSDFWAFLNLFGGG